MNIRNNQKRRLFYFIFFLLILLVPLLIQLFIFAVFIQKEPDAADISSANSIHRGPILDRNGKILAIQTKQNSVSAWIPDITDINETAKLLAVILDIDETFLLKRLQKNSGFLWIKRKVTTTEAQKIQDLLDNNSLSGIKLIPEMGRTYPKYNLASHILGYVGIDNIGLEGVEYAYNEMLNPPETGENTGTDIYGNQIFLTIDMNVQYTIEKIAAAAKEKYKAESVMILVEQAQTGEILGMCSSPDFNPNDFLKYSAFERNDRPVTMAYEPGSVMKIFTLSSMLDTMSIDEDDKFVCNGYYEKENFKIKCQGIHGTIDAQKILKYSCNAGAAYASEKIDKNTLYKMLTNFGFGRSTDLGLPGENPGILRRPSEWSARSKPTIAFGQEISVTALQIIQAATVFANDGAMLKPFIIKRIVSSDGKIINEYGKTVVHTVLSSNTARKVLLMMETATMTDGSARPAAVEGLRLAAKTGTAQMLDPKTGKYSETDFIPSLLGIFPVSNPQIILYVAVFKPEGQQYLSSRIAAPVFKQTIEELLTVMEINTDQTTTIEHSGEVKIIKPENIEIGQKMPDLTGTPKKLLLPLFKRQDITIIINGEGYVVSQQPLPGIIIKKGMKIVLELK
ncbi:MAG: PASTA domain-containing protein [Spirochaetales bacterium]|nr:PASTA domain-containing protein [Spirochaetales bacterium]